MAALSRRRHKERAAQDPPAQEKPAPKQEAPDWHDLHQTPVTVVIVADNDTIHKYHTFYELLVHHSSYFRAGLKREDLVNQATPQAVHLHDESPLDFSIFQQWMETQKLERGREKLSFGRLVGLYCFTQRLGIPVLGNAVIDAMHVDMLGTVRRDRADAAKFKLFYTAIGEAAARVKPGSGLYAYLTDFLSNLLLQAMPVPTPDPLVGLPLPLLWAICRNELDALHRRLRRAHLIVTDDAAPDFAVNLPRDELVNAVLVNAEMLHVILESTASNSIKPPCFAVRNLCTYHIHDIGTATACTAPLNAPLCGIWEAAVFDLL